MYIYDTCSCMYTRQKFFKIYEDIAIFSILIDNPVNSKLTILQGGFGRGGGGFHMKKI